MRALSQNLSVLVSLVCNMSSAGDICLVCFKFKWVINND